MYGGGYTFHTVYKCYTGPKQRNDTDPLHRCCALIQNVILLYLRIKKSLGNGSLSLLLKSSGHPATHKSVESVMTSCYKRFEEISLEDT